MIVEDFDCSKSPSICQLQQQKAYSPICDLFQKKELPCFDLQNLRTPNKFSTNPDFRFFVQLLERTNRIPDHALTEINWRHKSQTHTFIYSSLMAILFQPEHVGAKSLAQLASWYKRTNRNKKTVIPELKMASSLAREEALIRKTFKSSLPASIQKMTRRIYLDRGPTIKPPFQSQRSSQDKQLKQAWERCETRMYQGEQKRLKSNREQGEVNEQREQAILSRFVLLEKLANTNLLYSSSVLSGKPNVTNSLGNSESTEKLNENVIRTLKTVHVTRRYQALKVGRPRKSSLACDEKPASKLADIQGLTLMQSPFFKRKPLKIR